MKGSLVAILVLFLAVMGCAQKADESAVAESEEPAKEVAGETSSESSEPSEEDLLNKPDPVGVYGAGITLPEAKSVTGLYENCETLEGKLVRVDGTVADVCPRRGCWIDIVDADGMEIQVKVTDGDIVFPLSAKGKSIAVEGTLQKIEMTEEEARDWKEHLADEKGEEFDPTTVTGPEVMWRIKGAGAEISG